MLGFSGDGSTLGGEVITDMTRAELGAVQVFLTEDGKSDPLFGILGSSFLAPMGHQDCVVKLPPNAVRLAYSTKVENQAFKIRGKPIYGTQFHPELSRSALIQRLQAYPQYVEAITGEALDAFVEKCQPDDLQKLLHEFAQQ